MYVFDCNIKKLQVNNEKNFRTFIKEWNLNSMLLNNQWTKEETKGEFSNTLIHMKMETQKSILKTRL